MSVLDRIGSIRAEAEAAVAGAPSSAALEELRVRYLGRKAELPNLLRGVAQLPPEERGTVGRAANQARQALEALIETRGRELEGEELDARLAQDRIDITLPGEPPQPVGRIHLVTQTWREIEDVFLGLGFTSVEGPEIDLVHYNFDALNHTPTHPSRQVTDTFYVADDVVLRTHTSPVQIRTMEAGPPPIYMATAGRCYRRDTPDATHTAMFTQIEGLVVDRGITLAHLKGTLLGFARAIFGAEREVRLRPHFFPFTEPSVEVDVSCFNCARDGSPCRVCRGEGWVEILGAGMVDPNLYGYVDGYDPDEVSGFAFGLGVERVAGLRHDIPDIRLLWENDLRFTEQFG